MGDFKRLLHLRCGMSKNVGVATGGRSVHIARVREQTGRAPKEFDAGALLFGLEDFYHCIEIFIRLFKGGSFRSYIPIVESIKRSAQLFDELEGGADAVLRVLHALGAIIPGANGRADAERIGEAIAKGVPINDG